MSNPFPELVIATFNLGKLREFRSLLAPGEIKVLGLEDTGISRTCIESGSSFVENARQKALFYSMECRLPVLADDSGLEVFALEGRPGIHSARYAGPRATDAERNEKLLAELEASGGGRSARFVCALALAQRGKLLHEAEGECRGVITYAPRGSGGFGYDPIFFFPELGRTYAELSEQEKNQYSHRSRAVHVLLGFLRH